MIAEQHVYQGFPRRIVFVLGYSQSGKSTRINCIERQLEEIVRGHRKPIVGSKININFGSQSRHITPYSVEIRYRGGELSIMAVDYTGQDHQAAYYFLKKIYDMIKSIKDSKKSEDEKKKDVKTIFDDIMKKSREIIDKFMRPEAGIPLKDFMDIIIDPFNSFVNIASKYDIDLYISYKDAVIQSSRVLEVMGGTPKDIEQLIRESPETFKNRFTELLINRLAAIGVNGEKFPKIRVSDLNRILCRIDTVKFDEKTKGFTWNSECDNSDNIKIDEIGELGWLRGLVTGPLLTYLFLGLMIDSWITIILMPANFKKWYNRLKEIYLTRSSHREEDKQLQGDVKSAMIRGVKYFIKLDPDIEKGIETVCEQLVHRYVNESKPNEEIINKFKKTICSPKYLCDENRIITSIQDNNQKKSIEEIVKYVCDNNLIILWGGALAKIYHYELANVLLDLYLEYMSSVSSRQEKYFVFDLTYCENDNNQSMSFYKGLKSILSSDIAHEIEEEYVKKLRNIINAFTNTNIPNVNVYFLPSSMSDDTRDCTPFEAILITCVSEKALSQSISIVNKNTNEKKEISCNSLLEHTNLRQITEIIKEIESETSSE